MLYNTLKVYQFHLHVDFGELHRNVRIWARCVSLPFYANFCKH